MYSRKRSFGDLSLRQKRRISDQDVVKLCSVDEQTISNTKVNCESVFPIPNAFSMSTNNCNSLEHTQHTQFDHWSFSYSPTEVEREVKDDECFDCICESSDSEMESESVTMRCKPKVMNSFPDDLSEWVLKFNISHRAVSSLLKLLKCHGNMTFQLMCELY